MAGSTSAVAAHSGSLVFCVFHDADDLELRSQLPLHAEMLADSFAVEVAVRKHLIHDSDFASMVVVAIGEDAARACSLAPIASKYSGLIRIQVATVPVAVRLRIGLTRNIDAAIPVVVAQRRIEGKSSLLCAGDLHQPARAACGRDRRVCSGLISREEWIDAGDIAVLCLEAEVLLLQVVQAAQQQTGRAQTGQPRAPPG